MKKTRILVISALLILVVAATAVILFHRAVFGAMVEAEGETFLFITPDDTAETVIEKVRSAGECRQTWGLRLLAKRYGYADRITTGRYALRGGESAVTVMRRLATGNQSAVNLVVPSVRTMEQLSGRLAKQLMCDSLAFVAVLQDSVGCARRGYTPETLPCLILPNTYQVFWDMTPDQFLDRMEKEHDRFWNESRREAAAAVSLTPEEVATLASIVDEETANDEEKPMVAGLYLNRLRRGMLLQADPTVRFGIGDFTLRRILNEHLKYDSPYNTYLYAGLPPTPIRIPTLRAIESVLHPASHDYLYMCAKEDFSGTHNFASTLSAHLANARRYQQELNRRGIRR